MLPVEEFIQVGAETIRAELMGDRRGVIRHGDFDQTSRLTPHAHAYNLSCLLKTISNDLCVCVCVQCKRLSRHIYIFLSINKLEVLCATLHNYTRNLMHKGLGFRLTNIMVYRVQRNYMRVKCVCRARALRSIRSRQVCPFESEVCLFGNYIYILKTGCAPSHHISCLTN